MSSEYLLSTRAPDKRPKVAIYVMEGFSPFHISVPWLAFHDIRKDQPAFDTFLFSDTKSIVKSENLFLINATHDLNDIQAADIIIVPYWPDNYAKPSQDLIAALKYAHSDGKLIVGLCLGSYVLAYAGLLDGLRVSTHWSFEKDFAERFPRVKLDAKALYVDQGNIITSAGTAASLDCCLYIIERIYDSSLANHIARLMVIPPHRDGGQAQFMSAPKVAATSDVRINLLLDHLKTHLHEATGVEALAAKAGMSRRTFTRRFHAATGKSAIDWLTTHRLHYAQELLETTDLSVKHVSRRCGFVSEASFRYAFLRRFQVAPLDWRRQFNGQSRKEM